MAQRYQIVITQEAADGLRAIVEYLEEEASYEVAEKVRTGILATIGSLAEMPQRNSIVQEISDEETVFRRILKWSYRIVYTVQEDKIQVTVIDISHSKRDPQHLKDLLGK